jgi:hypothetical protein
MTFFGLAVVMMACSSVAPSAPGEVTGTDEGQATTDRVIDLGKCALAVSDAGTPPSPDALPPLDSQSLHIFESVEADRVLTSAELKITIAGNGKDRRVRKVQATIAQGATTGSVTVAAATLISTSRRLSTDNSTMSEARLVLTDRADKTSVVTLGTRKEGVDLVDLVTDPKTGRSWAIFGTTANKVIASAPSCTFDPKAWAILKNVGCEKALFIDKKATCEDANGGAPKPIDAGPAPAADAGVVDGSSDATSTTETVPPEDEPTGATPTEGEGEGEGDGEVVTETQDSSSASADGEEAEGEAVQPAPKQARERTLSCAAAPGTSGHAAVPVLLALALSALRRRRAGRP